MGTPRTLQARHYYTFGMEMSQLNNGTTDNKYQYNGKEIQDDFGLYWYDYGARFYDPELGRWHTQDPMAESYYSQSPYHFSGNNPILFVDANGMDYWSTNDPNEIARFLRSMQSGQGGFSSFDYQGWNHATDAQFLGNKRPDGTYDNLTYNDKTNMFYSSYGTVRDGVATSVGVSIQGIINSDNGNVGILSEAGANWLGKSSGAVESSYPIENLLIGGAVAKPLTFLAGRLLSGIAGRFAAKGVARSLDDLSSLKGASWDEAKSLIPKDWISGPMKKGEGIKFVNPAKKGEQILLEKGWPGAKDPLHAGPYMKISRDGQIIRIPLQGNPTLK